MDTWQVRKQQSNDLLSPRSKYRHPWPHDGIPRGHGEKKLAKILNLLLEESLHEVIGDEKWQKSNSIRPNPVASHGFGKAQRLLAAVYKKSRRPAAKGLKIDLIIKEALRKMRQGQPAFHAGGLITAADAHEYLRFITGRRIKSK
jgi:hypothetical protein